MKVPASLFPGAAGLKATTHDLVEARLWATGNGGPQNSVLDLTFDFRKVLPTGGYERLA